MTDDLMCEEYGSKEQGRKCRRHDGLLGQQVCFYYENNGIGNFLKFYYAQRRHINTLEGKETTSKGHGRYTVYVWHGIGAIQFIASASVQVNTTEHSMPML